LSKEVLNVLPFKA